MTQTIEQLIAELRDEEIHTFDGFTVADVLEQLTARVRELEEENARLKAAAEYAETIRVENIAYFEKQLAVAQADSERMSKDFCSAINHAIGLGLEAGDFLRCWNEGDWAGCREFEFNQEVISQPADTSALDSFVAEKVKEAMK